MMDDREFAIACSIMDSLWTAGIFLAVYMALIFENIPGFDYWTSLKVFCWGCGAMTLILIFVNAGRKTFLRKVFNITMPLGIYTVITYFEHSKKVFAVLGIVALVALVLYGLLIFTARIKNKRRKTRIIAKRIRKFLKGGDFVVNILMTVIVVGICARVFVTGFAFSSPTESVKSFEEAKQHTVEKHMEKLSLLAEDEWEKLTISEKLDVLQTVVNIEVNRLGCDTNIRVGASSQRQDIFGNYNKKKKTITVDRDHLMGSTPSEVLCTVLHECRHAYQERLVAAYDSADEIYKNLAIFKEAAEFKDGFENYGSRDYYSNPIEADARTYSRLMTREYLESIGLAKPSENDAG